MRVHFLSNVLLHDHYTAELVIFIIDFVTDNVEDKQGILCGDISVHLVFTKKNNTAFTLCHL